MSSCVARPTASGAQPTRIDALFLAAGGLELVPFEQADAREAADIRAYLRRQATPIGPYDVLIAGQARRAGASLVMANSKEFERVPGLIVMDWAV